MSRAKMGSNTFVPRADLGVAPGSTGNSGFAAQYGEPREADTVKLLAFPELGASFET